MSSYCICFISLQIYGTDELAMAKLRLRLPVYEDELNNKQKKKTDIFIVDAHEVYCII